MSKFVDLTGRKFSKLTILGRVWRLNSNRVYWLCKCECGSLRIIQTSHLKDGHSKSCGCLIGHNGIHYKTDTRLYKIWGGIKTRCLNPNCTTYNYYGGRGIVMCDEWKNNFQAFYDWAMLNGYQDNLELDRIDNDKNYSPDNCRWVTHKENCNNRRTSKRQTGVIKSWIN